MNRVAVAGVQARLSSTRLPGKVLLDVAGKPLIQRVVERVRRATRIDEVLVLTSLHPTDDPLASKLEELGIPYRRGLLEDVLSRFTALVEEFEPDVVVRVCADSPLIEPEIIDLEIDALRDEGADLIEFRGNEHGECEGTLGGVSVVSTRALMAARNSKDPRDLEHVGSFFYRLHKKALRCAALVVPEAYRARELRLCVDEEPDLELMRRVFAHFAPVEDFSTADAVQWLRENPDVGAINHGVEESRDNQALRRLDRRSA
jgi:spore coat polysaccharide biosynthesis protein SpsF